MAEQVGHCYDQLASNYHLIYADWSASIARQAAVIGPILEREVGESRRLRILDCACGIGTQALGLAARGHKITGSDASAEAVKRARREASERGIDAQFVVADMLGLSSVPAHEFDAVVCFDNSLPHLKDGEALSSALEQIRSKLRKHGIFMASIRDYDMLAQTKPAVQMPNFYDDDGRCRIVHQVWDWIDDSHYTFHLYITRETANGWECHHYASTYRALLRGELTTALEIAGFSDVRWTLPAESEFYQAIVLARAEISSVPSRTTQ